MHGAAALDAGGKTAEDGHTVICKTCHEPHGARNAWMLVLPPSRLCIACHADKSPETAPPAGAPMHHIGRAYPGFELPAGLVNAKATFGPEGELSCLSCHRLHDASGAKPLLIRKNEDSSLCLDCHKKEKAVLESPHDLRVSSPQTVNANGQTAAESGSCGACHRIHGWARDVPETHRPHSSGCMECHQSGGPGSRERLYLDAHTVGTPVPSDMATPLPLDEATGSIGCLTCHDPHSPRTVEMDAEAAEATTALNVRQNLHHPRIVMPLSLTDAEVQSPRSFLRREDSRLCVLCHDKIPDLLGEAHNPTVFAPAARDLLAVHPSVGPCRVCHTTHSARGPHLWTRTPASSAGRIADLCGACHLVHVDPNAGGVWAWPRAAQSLTSGDSRIPASDGPGSGVCTGCHRLGGCASERVAKYVDHPDVALVNRTATGQPGYMPTFDSLGQESQTGVISCLTCHEPHVPPTIAWEHRRMFLRPQTHQGLCVDCHGAETLWRFLYYHKGQRNPSALSSGNNRQAEQ